MTLLQIRPAEKKDYDAIHAIMLEAQDFHVQLRPDYFRNPSMMFSAEQFEQLLQQDIVLAAELDGELIACMILQRHSSNSPTKHPRKSLYIDSMAVSAAHRGRGIGTLLFDKAKEIAKKEGCSCLELQVYSDNEKALRLYEHLGFETRAMNMELKLN